MRLQLRSPFPAESWPRVWQWIQPFKNRLQDDFSPKSVEEYVASMERRTGEQTSFGVFRDGELGGLIWFERGNGVAGIVHVVFKRSFWGSRTTRPAMRAAASRYFETGAEIMMSVFFPDNDAVRAVVKDFGFKKAGALRMQTRRNGQLVGLEIWELSREEFYGNRNDVIGGRQRGSGSPQQSRQEADQHVNNDLLARAAVHAALPVGFDHEPVQEPSELLAAEDQRHQQREQDLQGSLEETRDGAD